MRTLPVLLVLLVASTASASPLGGDVEVDPTAYALSGNSIHAGLARGHVRVDLGNFGLELPRAIHGQDAFDVSFTGFGAKVQYFLDPARRGWFGGADVALARLHLALRDGDAALDDRYVSLGVHAGYRVALPANLYVTPWLGVGYNAGARDAMLDGHRYTAMRVNVFPAIHVGYRFE